MTPQSKLNVAFEQLQRMHQALADLRTNVLPRDPKLYHLMAEGTVAQIRDLQFQIDLESGVLALQQAESDIWVKAEGVEVEWPQARSSVLTAVLDSLRKGIQNAAEHLMGVGAAGGRPLEALKQACDLEVFALQPGSLMVGLKLPEVLEAQDRVDLEKVRQAVQDYLRAAAWASSNESTETLDREFEDESYRKLLLAEVKRLAPRNSGSLEAVQLSGRRIAPSVDARLTRSTARRIREAIYRDTEHPPQDYEGRIREIDLDNRSFTLRSLGDVFGVRCHYGEEFEETVKECLDRLVRVSGVVKSDRSKSAFKSSIEITNLEITEDEPPKV